MDTLLTLLLMGILYVASKIWNFYLSKVNKSPQIHSSTVPAVKKVPSKERKPLEYDPSRLEVQPHVTANAVKTIPNVESEKTAWSGKVDHNMLVNGVIFAEILQPPRAYRPFVKR